jgi:hypothetical protein
MPTKHRRSPLGQHGLACGEFSPTRDSWQVFRRHLATGRAIGQLAKRALHKWLLVATIEAWNDNDRHWET